MTYANPILASLQADLINLENSETYETASMIGVEAIKKAIKEIARLQRIVGAASEGESFDDLVKTVGRRVPAKGED